MVELVFELQFLSKFQIFTVPVTMILLFQPKQIA
jgi:hypothetical protein